MYEHRSQALLSRKRFVYRLLRHGLLALAVTVLALAIGICGFHFFEHLPWVDSFLSASLILGGMGSAEVLHEPAAKIFAGFYALFSGLIFIGVVGIIIFPVVHRFLHIFHLDTDQIKKPK
jgi:hypothetical protein